MKSIIELGIGYLENKKLSYRRIGERKWGDQGDGKMKNCI
jgi:hypothetical protein